MPFPPLGETLTWPPSPLGAVATKKTGWASMKARSRSSIASNSFMLGPTVPQAAPSPSLGPAPPTDPPGELRGRGLELLLRLLELLLGRIRHVGVVLDVVDGLGGGVLRVVGEVLGAGLDLGGGVLRGL